MLTVAVAAGLIVGVLGSNARRDAADLAAAESDVDLIVGAPVMVAAPDTPFQVPLYNAGALEVELLWVRPKGWTVAETATRHPIALPPNRWVPVRVRAIPDCTDFVSEDVVEMKVRTQTRERVITLPLPMAGLMRDVHTSVCRSFDQLVPTSSGSKSWRPDGEVVAVAVGEFSERGHADPPPGQAGVAGAQP
jgi:hypothetical protein